MIKWQAACDKVAPTFGRVHLHIVLARQRLDRFRFDERDLSAGTRRVGKRSDAIGVPVSLEAFPGDRSNGGDRYHGLPTFRCDANRNNFTLV